MSLIYTITARLQAHHQLFAASPGLDKLYSMLKGKLGKETSKKAKGGRQHVTWHLGSGNSGRQITLTLTLDVQNDKVDLHYSGLGGHIATDGLEPAAAMKRFRTMANRWLDSGDATPEDRETLERFI